MFTFNIVYTPGTVRHLRLFVPSLLEYTDCRFRLVGNGLKEREERRLEQLAGINDRLEYYRFPTQGMKNHGVVLDHLRKLETTDHFCFMDSDIFAVGDFVRELLPYLEGKSAFFSGAPVWSTAEDQVAPCGVRFCGPHNRAESGVCVGTTYFAVYDNRALGELLESLGISFEKSPPTEALPAEIRGTLQRMDCLTNSYEVGKLINLLLQSRGADIQYRDLDSIRHIGGLSVQARKHRDRRTPADFADAEPNAVPEHHRPDIRPWVQRKNFTCHYLGEVLHASLEGRAYEGPLLVEEGEIRQRVLETAERIRDLGREHGPLLARLDGANTLRARFKRLRRAVFSARKPVPTTAYYVLGMHRSGTSCLTGLLETSGLWIGNAPRQSKSNLKGNLEDVDGRLFNEKVLKRYGGSWRDPSPLIPSAGVDPAPILEVLGPYRRHERWVLKDPRMLFTLQLWLPHTPGYRLVGSFRHPLSVAGSLEKRNRMPVAEGVLLWKRYVRVQVALHRQRPFPLMNFDLEPEEYLRRFQVLCRDLDLPYNDGPAREFYENALVSHRHEDASSLDEETHALFGYLLEHQVK